MHDHIIYIHSFLHNLFQYLLCQWTTLHNFSTSFIYKYTVLLLKPMCCISFHLASWLLSNISINIQFLDSFNSSTTQNSSPTNQFPQKILPSLPLHKAQWWGYESLPAIALVYSRKSRVTTIAVSGLPVKTAPIENGPSPKRPHFRSQRPQTIANIGLNGPIGVFYCTVWVWKLIHLRYDN